MWYWHIRSRRIEALEWLDRGLALGISGSSSLSPAIKAKSLLVSGCHRTMEAENEQARVELEESLGLYRGMGSGFKLGEAFALRWLGFNEWYRNNYPQAERFCRESLVLCRELNDPFSTAECLFYLFLTLDDSSDHDHQEGLQVLREALVLFQEVGDLDGIASVYGSLGWSALDHHDPDQAMRMFLQSLSYYQQVGNLRGVAQIYDYISLIDANRGDLVTACELIEKASIIRREIGISLPHLTMCLNVGWLRLRMNQVDEARRILEGALAFYQKSGDQNGEFYAHLALGVASWKEGDFQQTARRITEAAAVAGKKDDPYQKVFLLGFQWAVCRFNGDEVGAETYVVEALKMARELIPEIRVDLFNMLAQSKARRQPEKAARLFGAAEHLDKGGLQIITPLEQTWHEAALGEVRAILGEQRMADLLMEGRAMSFEKACAYALEVTNVEIEPITVL